MRIFAALALPNEPRAALEAEINRLRRKYSDCGRWSQSKNLHLTMAFLGEATPDTAKKVATALAKVPQTAVCWRFSGLGVFSRQQILWAGLAETDRFNALAEQVRSCLDDMGQHYDRKPFRAHITLARQWQGPQPQALSSPLANFLLQSLRFASGFMHPSVMPLVGFVIECCLRIRCQQLPLQ